MNEIITEPKCILILEDDAFLRSVYTDKFTKAGCVVHAFSSVTTALEGLRGAISPHIILFDIVLPEKDGFDFLESIRTEALATNALKVALTNEDNSDDRARAQALGAVDYLIKAKLIPSEVVTRVISLIS
jgi:CheY-like chemotaxis protein